MSIRYRILPYKQGSRGAKALAEALGGKVLKLEGSRFVPRRDDVIINWGNVDRDPNLRKASNKLTFFQTMMEKECTDIIPTFWTRREDIPNEPGVYPIVCRTVLAGHSGDGIVIANNPEELVPAPLYVQYIKKADEYRIHVGSTNLVEQSIISVQRKARRLDTPDDQVNWKVRNLAGGFVYVRGGVEPPECVLDAAKRALRATGLTFGGCDVIYNERERKAYVLEINTACGIEGQTVEDYVRFFKGNQ